jgi:Uma2 family endonuclease
MKTYAEPPLTVADLEATPDDGNRYEVIDGELFVSAAPSIVHQRMLVRVAFGFFEYFREHPIGEVLPGIGVIFDDFNGVIPDLVFVTHERRDRIEADGRLKAAPEIVIEILSPGGSNRRRDRQVKRALYSKRGVSEYWIFDPEARAIEVYRKRNEGGFALRTRLQAGDELTSLELPGFRLAVASLF